MQNEKKNSCKKDWSADVITKKQFYATASLKHTENKSNYSMLSRQKTKVKTIHCRDCIFCTHVTLDWNQCTKIAFWHRITKPFVTCSGQNMQNGQCVNAPSGQWLSTQQTALQCGLIDAYITLRWWVASEAENKTEEHKGRCHVGNFAHVVSIADAAVFGRSLSHFLLHKKPVLTAHTVRFRISRNTIRNCSSILLCAGRSPFSFKKKDD